MFGGRKWDPRWRVARQEVQERFTWTTWESGTFLQGNVRLSQNAEYTTGGAMELYVTDLEPIPRSPQKGKAVHLFVGNKPLWLWRRCRPRIASLDPRTHARGPAQVASKDAQVCLETTIVEWVDASNATRTDGRSTIDILIDLTETTMIHGDECNVCPLVRRSCKIGQRCQSPSTSEAKALGGGKDEISAGRYQITEILGLNGPVDGKA